jgi:hypothetical protein
MIKYSETKGLQLYRTVIVLDNVSPCITTMDRSGTLNRRETHTNQVTSQANSRPTHRAGRLLFEAVLHSVTERISHPRKYHDAHMCSRIERSVVGNSRERKMRELK